MDSQFKIVLSAVNEANAEINRVVGSLGNIGAIASRLTGALAAAFSVERIITYTRRALEAAEATQRLSEETGIAVRELDALKAAAMGANMRSEELAVHLKFLNMAITESRDASSRAAAAFRAMGIGSAEGNVTMLKTTDIIEALRQKFNSYAAGADKVALAQEVFGRGGTRMISVLGEMKTSLGSYAAEMERLGKTTTPEAIAAAEELDRIQNELNLQFEKFFQALGAEVMPTVIQLVNAFSSLAGKGDALNFMLFAVSETVKGLAAGFMVTTAASGASAP